MRIAHVILYLALLCTMCTVYIQICFNLMQSYLYVWPQGTLTYCMNAIFSWCDSQGQSFNYTKKESGVLSISEKYPSIHCESLSSVYLYNNIKRTLPFYCSLRTAKAPCVRIEHGEIKAMNKTQMHTCLVSPVNWPPADSFKVTMWGFRYKECKYLLKLYKGVVKTPKNKGCNGKLEKVKHN